MSSFVLKAFNKDLIPSRVKQWFRNRIKPFNLLQPNYRYEIGIGILHDGDLKIRVPSVGREETKVLCNSLLQAASILAMKSGLKMVVNEKPPEST